MQVQIVQQRTSFISARGLRNPPTVDIAVFRQMF